VLVNSLGATPPEELYIFNRRVARAWMTSKFRSASLVDVMRPHGNGWELRSPCAVLTRTRSSAKRAGRMRPFWKV